MRSLNFIAMVAKLCKKDQCIIKQILLNWTQINSLNRIVVKKQANY